MLYSPLSPRDNHIRLLVLHPGNRDDEIRCDLTHYDLSISQQPGFEALSYTWGNPHDTSSILLNGEAFQVTKNLDGALRNLRRPPPSEDDVGTSCQYLWVDAICINQQDDRERSEQILRMRDIYRTAETTIVWLGEATAESEKAMKFMNGNKELPETLDSDLLHAQNYREEYLALVEGLLIRPWWHRIWIVQEVIVSSRIKVVCGPSAVDWETMLFFIAIVHEYHQPAVVQTLRKHSAEDIPSSSEGLALSSNCEDWHKSGPKPLYQLILGFQTWKATLPVDMIYGLLGMAVEANNPALKPSYKDTPQKVFRIVTRFIIEQHERLDFVYISTGFRNLEALPSWTPDFTVPVFKAPYVLKGKNTLFERCLYSAAKDVPMAVSFTDDSKILNAAGIRADSVYHLAPYWNPHRAVEGFEEEIFKSVLPLWVEVLSPVTSTVVARYGRDFQINLALAKILTADREADIEWTLSRFEPNKSFLDLPMHPPEEYNDRGPPQEQLMLWKDAKKIMITTALFLRRFMITKSGYIGLVPELTREDDVICVLFGCDTPLVLRPVGDYYTLVGECYVHGLMDGELVDCLQEGKAHITQFEIR